jgi:hypothetical protein
MILFSIPVHCCPEVIFDQVENIFRYAPDAGIIIHPAKQFVEQFPKLPSELESSDRVWVNDRPFYTGNGMVLKCHVSNFLFAIRKGLRFTHFSLNASNEMLVRPGVEHYIRESNFAFNKFSIDEEDFGFSHWREDFLNDRAYLEMMSERGNMVSRYVSQVEGTFYPKEAFESFAESFHRYAWREIPWPVGYVHGKNKRLVELFQRIQSNKKRRKYIGRYFYTREEFYPPNYFVTQCQNPARPYCYMNWKNSLQVVEEEIESIRNRGHSDGIDEYLYSVKRVPLDINDTLRKYIRNLEVQ